MRKTLLLLFTLLMGLLVWSYWRLDAARTAAGNSAVTTTACRRLVGQIKALQSRPSRAVLSAHSATQLSQEIEQAARRAELADDALVRIEPEAARRVDDTDYKQQPTIVEVRQATLAQLITFLSELTQSESGLRVAALHLNAPRYESTETEPAELWRAEVTLTYFIFAPKTPPSQS